MPGEDAHARGFDGLHRAKQWLDRTTRVESSWTVKDSGLKELLGFEWPHGGSQFSFDLGGKLRGGDLDSQMFVAEVKNYQYESDLPAHFKAFLAKCYVAFTTKPDRCDHFFWISWSPFQAQQWNKHATADKVRAAITANADKIFGTTDAAAIASQIDEAALLAVADRIWLLTLSAKQEKLVIAQEHYAEVMKMMLLEGS